MIDVLQKPVFGNIAMYTIPTVQQQQQLPSSNLVLMQTNTTTSSASGTMGQQLQQQPEHLLYQDLLQSMNSQWNNSNQQLPRPGAVGQLPVSHPQHQQPIQYTNSRQPMSPAIPNIVLTGLYISYPISYRWMHCVLNSPFIYLCVEHFNDESVLKQGCHRSWKVMELDMELDMKKFKAWKTGVFRKSPEKSWNLKIVDF